MINNIGKKIHTLVKENTPRCHKIRQECICGVTQKVAFFYISLCFLPHCCANTCMEVRLMLPNTYQEICDTHTCLNFSKTYRSRALPLNSHHCLCAPNPANPIASSEKMTSQPTFFFAAHTSPKV